MTRIPPPVLALSAGLVQRALTRDVQPPTAPRAAAAGATALASFALAGASVGVARLERDPARVLGSARPGSRLHDSDRSMADFVRGVRLARELRSRLRGLSRSGAPVVGAQVGGVPLQGLNGLPAAHRLVAIWWSRVGAGALLLRGSGAEAVRHFAGRGPGSEAHSSAYDSGPALGCRRKSGASVSTQCDH